MHDAVAATEMVYYASEKLDENAMHYEHRQQAPWGCGAIRPGGCVFLLLLLETDKRPRVTRERVTRWFGWFSVFGWRRVVLLSLSAKQLVTSALTFLSAFRLLPRLEEVSIRRVHFRQSHASLYEGLPTRSGCLPI